MIKTLFVVLVCTISYGASALEVIQNTETNMYDDIKKSIGDKRSKLSEEYDVSKMKRQGRMAQANKRFLEGGAAEEMRRQDEKMAASIEQKKRAEEAGKFRKQIPDPMMYERAREQGRKDYDEYQKQHPLPAHPLLPLQGE